MESVDFLTVAISGFLVAYVLVNLKTMLSDKKSSKQSLVKIAVGAAVMGAVLAAVAWRG